MKRVPDAREAHPGSQVCLVVEVQHQELLLVARLGLPGSDLFQGGQEGALVLDGDGAEGGVAADGLGVPVDGVAQQLGHDVHGVDQQVYLAVVAPAVCDAQGALQGQQWSVRLSCSAATLAPVPCPREQIPELSGVLHVARDHLLSTWCATLPLHQRVLQEPTQAALHNFHCILALFSKGLQHNSICAAGLPPCQSLSHNPNNLHIQYLRLERSALAHK